MSGSGMAAVTLVIFLTSTAHMTDYVAGLVILVSALGGRLVAPLGARIVISLGSNRAYVAMKFIAAGSLVMLVMSRNVVVLTILLAVYYTASAIGGNARNLTIGSLGLDSVVEFRAKLRSIANGALVAGSALAAFALVLWPPSLAATICVVGNALSCVLCSLVMLGRFPESTLGDDAPGTASRKPPAPSRAIRHDWFRLQIAALVLGLAAPILTFALPLWLLNRVAPTITWASSAAFATSSLVVILSQVRISRLVVRNPEGRWWLPLAGLFVAVSLFLVAGSTVAPEVGAVILVLLASVALAISEVLFAAVSSERLFKIRHPGVLYNRGATLSSMQGIAQAVGPSILVATCLNFDYGWLIAGLVFLAITLMLGAHRSQVPVQPS